MKAEKRPVEKWKLLLAIGLPLALGGVFLFLTQGRYKRHEKIVQSGIHVPGRLLSVEETGTRINKVDELELVIEFQRKDGVLDTSSIDFLPARRSQHLFQPGTPVTVAYDSTNPDEITVVSLNTDS